MKQIFTKVAAAACLLYSANCWAQFSVSLGGSTRKYFGKTIGLYPQVNPNTTSFIFGGKLRLGYGFFHRHSVNLGVAYFAPSAPVERYGDYLIDMSFQNIELEFNYHYYFSGRYDFPEAKAYLLTGFSAINSHHRIVGGVVELVAPGERKFFENRRIETGHWNLGIGGEVPLRRGSAFWFLEAKAAIHVNAFVKKTTIWETSLINFGSATTGVRFLIGGPKRKGGPPPSR